jgi:hypothetical protein
LRLVRLTPFPPLLLTRITLKPYPNKNQDFY